MRKGSLTRKYQQFFSTGRAAQAGWLLFLLVLLSLALPGWGRYREALQTACHGSGCLVGQLTPAEASATLRKGESITSYGEISFLIFLSTNVFLLVTASALIWRRPTNLAAVCGGFLFTSAGLGTFLFASGLGPAPGSSLIEMAAPINQWIQYALFVPFFGLIPNGRFRPAWGRWAALAGVPAAGLAAFGLGGEAGRLAFGILAAGATIAVVLHRWLADRGQHEPTVWTISAAALLAGSQALGRPVSWLPFPPLPLSNTPGLAFSPDPVFGMLLIVGALTCLLVALLGDELFQVDVALNRAIVYSLLTLFVIGSYVLIVGYLSMIFQSSGNLWLSLVATGVVAALFHPIRLWVQRFVNRMIYGERDDPYTVITQLGQRLETVIASDEVIPLILRTVRDALKIDYAAIALPQGEEGNLVVSAEEGSRTPVALALPLVDQTTSVGELRLGSRQGENGFSPADRRLLDGLARQAGAAIHAARLNAELQQARERLVIAQEEERRRIRRDLHDGLGAALAALTLQAGEVQRLISADPATASRRLDDLRGGLRSAVSDTRRLVYGLRPPALDELGLLDALRSRVAQYQGDQGGVPGNPADTSVQVRLDAPDALPSLPAAVEVAVYRIVEEGLANIIHHAQARSGLITLRLEDQGIRLEIRDDGLGLPEVYSRGIGLNSMHERASELGGTWSIQSAPGEGTQVCAWLPLVTMLPPEARPLDDSNGKER